jgi:ferrous-iron efflux pump FieF
VEHAGDATTARRTALNVSAAAVLLAAAKGAVGLISGSVALLSSALDSAGDALASFANFVFLHIASKPPDENHPFGHGKAEHLAAMLQGLVMLGGAVALAIGAVHRIREPRPVEASTLAIATMVASIVATVLLTRYLKRGAANHESTALAGDALHYTSDILANAATIVALLLARWTGNTLFDSLFGVSVACWIAWNALYLMWNAANDLMDVALPDEEISAIVSAIERTDPAVVGYRQLRTRRAAGVRFIEFELLIDRGVSFEDAHDSTEAVKAAILGRFPRTVVTVHAEPA